MLTQKYTLYSKHCVCSHRQTITSIVNQVNQHQHLTASLSLFCEVLYIFIIVRNGTLKKLLLLKLIAKQIIAVKVLQAVTQY